jgi:hypothetical protein
MLVFRPFPRWDAHGAHIVRRARCRSLPILCIVICGCATTPTAHYVHRDSVAILNRKMLAAGAVPWEFGPDARLTPSLYVDPNEARRQASARMLARSQGVQNPTIASEEHKAAHDPVN